MTDYLLALAAHAELTVAVSGEAEPNSVDAAVNEGLDMRAIGSIGLPKIQARLGELVESRRPDVIHLMWYGHEQLTLLARAVADSGVQIIYECRDPLTTLLGHRVTSPGPQPVDLERDALRCADAHIFVSNAVRTYLENLHRLDLSTSLIVPQGLSERTMAAPSPKRSARDGRVHVVLVGTASADVASGRCYTSLIRRLVAMGLVVHSHFFDFETGANDVYRLLDRELADYHYHDALPDRHGTELGRALSSYDLMCIAYFEGVITDATLAVVMPSKAAAAWVHGLPVVTPREYRGVVEWIDDLGIGFVVDSFDDLEAIRRDRAAIERATEACLRHRASFTHEASARRVAELYRDLVARRT